ncbi:MAG: DUF99 family protein [Thermoplasmatales archaeon]|nr:DUF99 family protein [Candidatus Thermoplasmatota archaeon]MCL6002662.1 DUF99 family protein [Candidatus Thermoplasmatota archaeon]MDA8055941.1 DUF99 family protein [Thermoplasmatales archaeon]
MDQNLLFNKDTRIFAFDDSPFTREDEFTSIVGVIMRKDLYIESLSKGRIRVDGDDVTEKMIELVYERGSGVRVIMTQGTTFAGFNVLDINRLFNETGTPIINVVDHRPDMDSIREALRKYFDDWEARYSVLSENFTRFNSLYVQSLGIEPDTANKFIEMMTVNGIIPEPLRIADMVAGIC